MEGISWPVNAKLPLDNCTHTPMKLKKVSKLESRENLKHCKQRWRKGGLLHRRFKSHVPYRMGAERDCSFEM